MKFNRLRVVAVLGLPLCACAGSVRTGTNDSGDPTDGPRSAMPVLPACKSGPLFQVAPVHVEDVEHLGPLGSLVPPDHTFPTPHMYIYSKVKDGGPIAATVYAPADMVLVSAGLRHYDKIGTKTDYIDYTLVFAVCAEVDMYFHHVSSVSHPAIAAAIDAEKAKCKFSADGGVNTGGGSNEQYCAMEVRADVKAGDAIGTSGDKEARVGGLDWGARDRRMPNGRSGYINPARHCPGQNVFDRCYAFCGFESLPSEVYAPYRSLFTDFTGTVIRQDEPHCGTTYADVPGTAQGYWFAAQRPAVLNGPEEYELFLGSSPYTAAYDIFSMGRNVPDLKASRYVFRPSTSGNVNRRFAQLLPGETACYEALYDRESAIPQGAPPLTNLTILVKLETDAQKLTVEKRPSATCGTGPWTFGNSVGTFIR